MEKTISAYSKINYYLDVIGKRNDGYHEIESIMQTVSLADEVTLSYDVSDMLNNKNTISLSCTNDAVPCDRKNIAYRCAELFLSHFGLTDIDIKISIDKRIPISGGLAGGSTDGAAVLKLLNELSGINASDDVLCSLGAKIGADIPFCLTGGTCLCKGIGEKLSKLTVPKPKYHILIVSSISGVSTVTAYGLIDALTYEVHPSYNDALTRLHVGDIPDCGYNIFERAILPVHPSAALNKNRLYELGADFAMMSGSGPSVFALFTDQSRRDRANDILKREGIISYPCESVLG